MKPVHHLLFLIGLAVLLFCDFWFWLVLEFEAFPWAFVPPLIVLGCYIWAWVLCAFPKFGKKTLMYPCLLFVLTISVVMGVSSYRHHINNIPTVASEFNRYDYRPFSAGHLAALSSPSTLQLTDKLPKIDGSTALYPLYSAFATAVYPKSLADDYDRLDKTIALSKTGKAYERLLNQEVDMIFVPEPSKEHLAAAKALGVEFHLTPIGKEAFVFFVNSKNPVNGLSVEQIKQIYAGNIKNWQDVGGNDDEIRAFQRPENSGSQTALQKIMGDTPLMNAPREDVAQGMGDIINQVADYRNFDNALGYSFLFYSTKLVKENQIKLLAIDGVLPSHDNIRNETYPFAHPFYVVTLGNESDEVRAFIDWILSPQGQELVEKTGYVPINHSDINSAQAKKVAK